MTNPPSILAAANPDATPPTADRVEKLFHPGLTRQSQNINGAESDGSSESGSSAGSENGRAPNGQEAEYPKLQTRDEQESDVQPPQIQVSTLVEATSRLDVRPDPEDDGEDIILLTPTRRKVEIAAPISEISPPQFDPTAVVAVASQILKTDDVRTIDKTTTVEVSETPVPGLMDMVDDPIGDPQASLPLSQDRPETASDATIARLLAEQDDIPMYPTGANESGPLKMPTGRKRPPKQQQPAARKKARKGKEKGNTNRNSRPRIRNSDVHWSTVSSDQDDEGQEHDEDNDSPGMDIDPDLAGPAHEGHYAEFIDRLLRTSQENQVSAADLQAEADAMEESGGEEHAASVPPPRTVVREEVIVVIEGEDDDDDGWTDESDSDESETGGRIHQGGAIVTVGGGFHEDELEDDEDDDDDDSPEDEDNDLFQQFKWEEDDMDPDDILAIQVSRLIFTASTTCTEPLFDDT